jgi:putative hydrolase of the HAD superfamily
MMIGRENNCFLFDLGGVLVDWGGTAPLVELSRDVLEPERVRLFWLESEWVRRFETGRCSPEAFAAGVIDELNLHIAPTEFLDAFISWDKGPLPGSVDLVRSLKAQYQIACLSNNNILHWNNPPLRELVSLFDPCLVSFEIGLMKPEPAVYALAVQRIGKPPRKIIYFDDQPECVRAAKEEGLQAFQVNGPDDIRGHLNLKA